MCSFLKIVLMDKMCMNHINFCWTQSLFSAIIQKPVWKSNWLFVEKQGDAHLQVGLQKYIIHAELYTGLKWYEDTYHNHTHIQANRGKAGLQQVCYLFPLEISAELLVLLQYLLRFDLDLHHPLPQVNIALVFHWDTFFFVFIIITIFWFIINILS